MLRNLGFALRLLIASIGPLLLSREHATAQFCDTADVNANFLFEHLQAYDYAFTPAIDTNGNVIVSVLWQFSNGSPDATSDALPFVSFPGPGHQLTCLTANAIVNGQSCQAVHCELIDVPEDNTGCDGVINDFTIQYNAPEIVFISQSVSQAPISSYEWDFGDGTTGTGETISHTYTDFGAYQACLTIATGNCITTFCHWIYLGPDQLPCDSVLNAEFSTLMIGRTVGVWDASTASGLGLEVTWDLGDGTTGTGAALVHTYASDGVYPICASVSASGQLLQDTCTITVCHDVFAFYELTSVPEAGPIELPRVFPLPTSDVVNVEWPAIKPGSPWEVLDLAGRSLLRGRAERRGSVQVDLSSLRAGAFVLRWPALQGSVPVRLLKR